MSECKWRKVPFLLIPRDNRLPIRRMSVGDCISSHDPQFTYGYRTWDYGGKSDNPFYWMNEDWRWYYNQLNGYTLEDGDEVPSGYNFYHYYNKILKEWHENWQEICQELLDHHTESVSLEYKHFKVVSNIDTSFMDFSK